MPEDPLAGVILESELLFKSKDMSYFLPSIAEILVGTLALMCLGHHFP